MKTIQIHKNKFFKSKKTIPINKIVYIEGDVVPIIYVSYGWRVKSFQLYSPDEDDAIEILKKEFSLGE